MIKAHKIATLFTSYIQLHMVSIEDKQNRLNMMQFCSLAWNISLFPEAAQHETQVEVAWNAIKRNLTDSPLPGLEHSFKKDLNNLILLKLYLFPYTTQSLQSVQFIVIDGRAWIRIKTDTGIGEAPLASGLDVRQFPAVINVLHEMGKSTNEQLILIENIQNKSSVQINEFIDRLSYNYCLQRSNLYWYQLLIEVWQEQTHPRFRPVIGRWLFFIEKLKIKTQLILVHVDKMILNKFDPAAENSDVEIA